MGGHPPPTWAVKLVQRAERTSIVTAEGQNDFEERVSGRIRTFQDRIERQEDALKHCQGHCTARYVNAVDYEQDEAVQKQELDQIKLNLASINGLLSGIMSAMNILDTLPSNPPEGRRITPK